MRLTKLYSLTVVITLTVIITATSIPIFAEASDVDLERDLQRALEQSRDIVLKAEEKIKLTAPFYEELNQLRAIAEDIKASHLLLQERFNLREEAVKSLGAKAQERQKVISEGYKQALEEYLALIESLRPDGVISQSEIHNLKLFLDKILPKKKKPIFGSLPYKNLKYPSREPDTTSPVIKPAYKGGNKVVSPDDLKDTAEAPISKDIAVLAQSLNWNPVSIYEYVKNNIETEWYWGCMKGAEETLRQKSGNDCDQSTLLAALLRSSGFPTRYVRGTIEFFAGGRDGINIEKVKNLTGIDDPLKIAEFFQKAGIPFKPVITGGKITNFQIEHIWIESRIPYANYRGAIIDEHGKTWLGLDTSIKVLGYQYNTPPEIPQEINLPAIRDEYLSTIQNQTPVEYLKTKLTAFNSQQLADSYKLTKTLIPENMKILPASLQFDQKRITHEYTQIPEELKHKVKVTASDINNTEILTVTLDAQTFSNKSVAITYEPETVEDQQIINSYGGLDNTPAYLVRLRPVLTVNKERIVVGKDGLSMGSDYNLALDLISPNGTEKIKNTMIAGDISVIGIVSQKAVKPEALPLEDKDAERLMYEEAINYIERWNGSEEELASLMHLSITRPIPTVVTVGGVIDVTYLLDTPHGFTWKGVFVDADLRAVEATTKTLSSDNKT
ncbi:MAG: transglutaminase-like domain-containing protein, partial [Nitrospirota bacterium]